MKSIQIHLRSHFVLSSCLHPIVDIRASVASPDGKGKIPDNRVLMEPSSCRYGRKPERNELFRSNTIFLLASYVLILLILSTILLRPYVYMHCCSFNIYFDPRGVLQFLSFVSFALSMRGATTTNIFRKKERIP